MSPKVKRAMRVAQTDEDVTVIKLVSLNKLRCRVLRQGHGL